jgi:2,4-dienoyl-CoA reductase-like NADH-dependent reductase (Old Yellow Enzyme family)
MYSSLWPLTSRHLDKMLASDKSTASARTRQREAFFHEFASAVRKEYPNATLIVTGGFRSRKGMEAAVSEGTCDMVGLGRPAVLSPHLPRDIILNPRIDMADARAFTKTIDPPWYYNLLNSRAPGAGYELVRQRVLTSSLHCNSHTDK